ncbi:tldc domain containing protein 2 [Diplodia corticola]|uniref:Restriction of telomere capping protein 5 n=1 Tax=Diplodia corticola TaxID=236234 RepID=A0A1J9SB17_9PEZI|nr:tldc domain containing protein 2 [Diplodia corticola]OJD36781.1 tldc domain containing protein 2 [Diplodia corticola]
MGQGYSADVPPPTYEQLSLELVRRFADKCYTPLEIYCFKVVFKALADSSSGIRHWSEPTLCRFLALPDSLAVGSVVFHMASYLGAFPFPSQAPAILTSDNLLKVVTLLTRRHTPVLGRKGDAVWIREIYRSLAVYDRGLQQATKDAEAAGGEGARDGETQAVASYAGFAVDAPVDDDDDEDDGDALALAALDTMDAIDVFKQGEQSTLSHSIIPTDNFLRLIQLLLFIAPLEAQDDLAVYGLQLTDKRLKGLRETANNILSSFGIEKSPGVNYKTFHTVVSSSLPYMFDGLNPLFEHFLFTKDFDLSKRKNSATSASAETAPESPKEAPKKQIPAPEPILLSEGEILDFNLVNQLSFLIKGNNLFRRLRPLYAGGTHGFSMGSFEKSVFNWRAPSILLVSGSLLSDKPETPSERAFADSLPPKRLPSSLDLPSRNTTNQTLTFGAYIPVPWKGTPKTAFGDASTKLFQLSPTHDLFAASTMSTDYVYLNKPPHHPSGIGLGSPIPQADTSRAHSRSHGTIPLGAVSLHLDSGLEFGVFTHLAEGGGSFHPSRNPHRRNRSWQDRFAIEAIEVWGCGGDDEAEAQRKAWAWEEREAEARRRINLGTGDIDADRELLRLAGILHERSGGSM